MIIHTMKINNGRYMFKIEYPGTANWLNDVPEQYRNCIRNLYQTYVIPSGRFNSLQAYLHKQHPEWRVRLSLYDDVDADIY